MKAEEHLATTLDRIAKELSESQCLDSDPIKTLIKRGARYRKLHALIEGYRKLGFIVRVRYLFHDYFHAEEFVRVTMTLSDEDYSRQLAMGFAIATEAGFESIHFMSPHEFGFGCRFGCTSKSCGCCQTCGKSTYESHDSSRECECQT